MKYQPIIPWIGGKRRLSRHILPAFPAHTCYVEPFAGGAALFFLKEPSKVEVLNDVNLDLVTLYRVIQHHLEEFIRQFKWSLTSRKMYGWLKITDPDTLTDIQKAARFYYLQRLSFGGKVSSRTFGTATTSPPRLNLLRIEEELSQAHLRLARVYVEHLPWEQCIEKYDRQQTFFYLDPPYWQTEGYGVPFEIEQYQRIASLMGTMKGRAILSINDHPDIRKVFSDYQVQKVKIDYTVGGAGKGKGRQELIIKNY
ncbi:restriction endonuclease subunit M [Geotalea uraniireducens]|uniref:site-specific DNA-methyltransferase (adenine-specific) n=1 Tax=Geotalea uraniireducens TaxID=351604 RepID=A0ABM8EJ81_9BACT|nr:DNA adenine methylase [Geotalea uraniireducens]BDV42453.1 restriction endonuclease subunit M [Geotalea uraniireducens]